MGRIKLIVSLLWMSLCECKVAMYGHLQSPMFPEPYSSDLHMRWYLKVPHGYKIQLTFNHLDIQPSANCTKDSLTVLSDDEVLGKFCGQSSTDSHHPGTQPILFPVNHLWLVFETNTGPQTHLGFFIFYQVVGAVDCGLPKISDPDLMALTEENPLTTYKQNISFKCLLEYYQLVGDANFICDASGNWVSDSGQNASENPPQCVPVCGMNQETFSAGRIFGGQDAKLGQIPWQLLVNSTAIGGASLISDRWAITAGHLMITYESETPEFFGGMVDGLDQNAVRMKTEKIIVHPLFDKDPGRTDYNHDIALVKMSARVPISPKIMPVCLPQKSNGPAMEGKMGTVSGFGLTHQRLVSRLLQYGHVKEYPEATCFKKGKNVTDNMFCAGEHGVDSCNGDGGGPLVVPMVGFGSPEMPFQIKGIVSWGPSGCGDKTYYTKVENYLDWIRETMEKN